MLVSSGSREGVGYHYCPWSSWEAIQREGLVPYRSMRGATVGKSRVVEMAGGDVPLGVYLWVQPHSGGVHVGNIVQRAMAHRTWRICLLRVTFPLRDVIALDRIVVHTGSFASADPNEGTPWVYHVNEPAIMLSQAVPPERISLAADYDLERLLANPQGQKR